MIKLSYYTLGRLYAWWIMRGPKRKAKLVRQLLDEAGRILANPKHVDDLKKVAVLHTKIEQLQMELEADLNRIEKMATTYTSLNRRGRGGGD